MNNYYQLRKTSNFLCLCPHYLFCYQGYVSIVATVVTITVVLVPIVSETSAPETLMFKFNLSLSVSILPRF